MFTDSFCKVCYTIYGSCIPCWSRKPEFWVCGYCFYTFKVIEISYSISSIVYSFGTDNGNIFRAFFIYGHAKTYWYKCCGFFFLDTLFSFISVSCTPKSTAFFTRLSMFCSASADALFFCWCALYAVSFKPFAPTLISKIVLYVYFKKKVVFQWKTRIYFAMAK